MSALGFTIVGYEYDIINQRSERYFETPYSLLDFISPKYRCLFGNDLKNKLEELKKQRELSKEEEEEDENELEETNPVELKKQRELYEKELHKMRFS